MNKNTAEVILEISMTFEQYIEIKRRADKEDIHVQGFMLEHAIHGIIPDEPVPDEFPIENNTRYVYI